MKFEVIYNDWDAVKKEPVNKRLAVLDDLRDACHVTWALREVRRGKFTGSIMAFGTKGGRYEHSLDICLGCEENADSWRYSENRPRSADDLFARAEAALEKSIAGKKRSDRRFQWLKKIVSPEHYAKALGSTGPESPHYDVAFRDAFLADDFAKAEAMLAAKGWLAAQPEMAVAA